MKEIPLVRQPDCKWARNDAEKAGTFVTHLIPQFQVNDTNTKIFPQPIPDKSNSKTESVTPLIVAEEIDKISRKKSSGPDDIASSMLQELPKKGIIFTLC